MSMDCLTHQYIVFLICGFFIDLLKDCFGVNTSLVREGTDTSNGVVEWRIDFNNFCNHILNFLDHLDLIFAFDVIRRGNNHSGHQTTERCNAVSFSDSKDTGINMSSTCLQRTKCVGDCTTGVVMEMSFDITRDNTS
jgi:hypothetical protein